MSKRPRLFDDDHIEYLTLGTVYLKDPTKNEWGYSTVEAAERAWPKAREVVFRRLIEQHSNEHQWWTQRFCPLMPWAWWLFESADRPDMDSRWRSFDGESEEAAVLRQMLVEGKIVESQLPDTTVQFLKDEHLYREGMM